MTAPDPQTAAHSHAASTLRFDVQGGGTLRGRLRVPGDKSVSHRSIMLGSIATGITEVSGFLNGEDCLCTLKAFRAMGVTIEELSAERLRIHGVGLHGLRAPRAPLDLGNSGTSMRLMTGLLSGQKFGTQLTGDASLSRRPMRRILDPLRSMGAEVHGREGGLPPLTIDPVSGLRSLKYVMPVASAQVKSCLLLAGLYAQGRTCVQEPAPSRDHTERMLKAFGYPVHQPGDGRVCVEGGGTLTGTQLEVPADLSSAAFFLVGASIAPGSDLVLEAVGINPTRTGVIDILRLMGADIRIEHERMCGGEPVADLHVRHAPLHGIVIPEHLVPLAIDEFPALFIAAACAEGETVLTGAEELRVKESDRIAVMARGLRACGIQADPTPDGIRIQGGRLEAAQIDSAGDHRIAMSFTLAALRASGSMRILDCANVATSFPGFVALARHAGVQIEEHHA